MKLLKILGILLIVLVIVAVPFGGWMLERKVNYLAMEEWGNRASSGWPQECPRLPARSRARAARHISGG
jgi:hypothetical protein